MQRTKDLGMVISTQLQFIHLIADPLIEEAMYAHTITSAYADFAENEKGSLEPGNLADLIVWAYDPFSVDTRDIIDLTVDLPMVGGKIVHEV